MGHRYFSSWNKQPLISPFLSSFCVIYYKQFIIISLWIETSSLRLWWKFPLKNHPSNSILDLHIVQNGWFFGKFFLLFYKILIIGYQFSGPPPESSLWQIKVMNKPNQFSSYLLFHMPRLLYNMALTRLGLFTLLIFHVFAYCLELIQYVT